MSHSQYQIDYLVQSRVKTDERIIHNARYADDTISLAENSTDFKQLLGKAKEEITKSELQLNIRKTRIITTECFITGDEETKTARDVQYLGSVISLKEDCSHMIGTGRN